jgi:hypothetical protein
MVDYNWQDESVVVIHMLAVQIDMSGCAGVSANLSLSIAVM